MNDRKITRRIIRYTLVIGLAFSIFIVVLYAIWNNPLLGEDGFILGATILITALLTILLFMLLRHCVENLVIDIDGWIQGRY